MLKQEEMKKNRNKDKGPRDNNPKNKKEQKKDETFQPVNTGLITTDAEEWKGVELNNENKARNEMDKTPMNRINTEEDEEGREEAEDELNTHEQKKITNKNVNIVNKPD
jgi:hypothetical protein